MKNHYNGHRTKKRGFQVFLTLEQQKTLDSIKSIRSIDKSTELITTLLKEEEQRLIK